MYTTRSRTADSMRPTFISWQGVTENGSPFSGTTEVSERGETKAILDVPHPGYKQRIRRGEIVMGDMVISRTSREMTEGYMLDKADSGLYQNVITGDFISQVSATIEGVNFSLDHPAMYDIALAKAMANANKSVIDGGELIGSADQTLRMLRRPLDSANDLLTDILVRGKLSLKRTGPKALKAIANAWLEKRYGWDPIISDVCKLITEYKRNTRKWDERLVARGGCSQTGTWSGAFDRHLLSSLLTYWTATGTVSLKKEVVATAGVIFNLKPLKGSDRVADVTGLKLRDVPQSLYELMPWSFVFDWFVNLGDWLQAVTPNPNVNVLGSWVTIVDRSILHKEAPLMTYPVTQYRSSEAIGYAGSETVTTESVARDTAPVLAHHPVIVPGTLSLLQSIDACALSLNKVLEKLKSVRH